METKKILNKEKEISSDELINNANKITESLQKMIEKDLKYIVESKRLSESKKENPLNKIFMESIVNNNYKKLSISNYVNPIDKFKEDIQNFYNDDIERRNKILKNQMYEEFKKLESAKKLLDKSEQLYNEKKISQQLRNYFAHKAFNFLANYEIKKTFELLREELVSNNG
jgi:hypothetical protein